MCVRHSISRGSAHTSFILRVSDLYNNANWRVFVPNNSHVSERTTNTQENRIKMGTDCLFHTSKHKERQI